MRVTINSLRKILKWAASATERVEQLSFLIYYIPPRYYKAWNYEDRLDNSVKLG